MSSQPDERYAMIYASEVFSNLNMTEFRVLVALKVWTCVEGSFDLNELSKNTHLNISTIGRAVHSLRKRGLVTVREEDGVRYFLVHDEPLSQAKQIMKKAAQS
jgi:predicted transcriptional regulator